LSNEELIEEVTNQLPLDEEVVKNVLAMLCDEGVDLECQEGKVSRKIKGPHGPPGKPIRFEKEDIAKRLASTIESELGGESLEYVQLTVKEEVDTSLIKAALEVLNQTKAKIEARRRV